jgi:(2Fe-2S) ferredoxin
LERCFKELYRESDIIVTATDFVPSDDSDRNVQIISYPEKIIYSVPLTADFYLFIRDVILKEDFEELDLSLSLAAASIKNVEAAAEISDSTKSVGVTETAQLESVIPNTLPWKTLILVCVHGSRDNRCGRAGPQVIEEFKRQLLERSIKNDSVTVAGCSHIGGHKYAGVLVVYPSGDWYGLISKRNVGELLDNILAGTKYLKGWRGNESLNW